MSFNNIIGSLEVDDMRKTTINIENLEHGQMYSFRVYAASIWGYGPCSYVHPKSVRISSSFILFNNYF